MKNHSCEGILEMIQATAHTSTRTFLWSAEMKLLTTTWNSMTVLLTLGPVLSLPFSSVLNLSSSVWHWDSQENSSSSILILYSVVPQYIYIYISSSNRSFSCPPPRLVLYSFPFFLLTVFHLLPHSFQDPSQSPPTIMSPGWKWYLLHRELTRHVECESPHTSSGFTLLIKSNMIEWSQVTIDFYI